MVRLQLVWSDEPVPIIQPDGIDANEIEEWDAENPAVLKEETHRNHAERHINICQKVNPDDAASVAGCIKYCRSGVMPIVPYAIPMPQHQWYRCPLRR